LDEILWDTRVIPPIPAPILPLSIEFLKTFSKKTKKKGRKEFYFISKINFQKKEKEKFGFIWG
jgi:hypothetical protein